jgi:hypothetical protein
MINNLFRLVFAGTLAIGAVLGVVGHLAHGGSDSTNGHTFQKKVDRPGIVASDRRISQNTRVPP